MARKRSTVFTWAAVTLTKVSSLLPCRRRVYPVPLYWWRLVAYSLVGIPLSATLSTPRLPRSRRKPIRFTCETYWHIVLCAIGPRICFLFQRIISIWCRKPCLCGQPQLFSCHANQLSSDDSIGFPFQR